MPRRTVGNPLSASIYIGAFALGCYPLNYLVNNVILPPHLAGGGHWQFLTNLSLLFSLMVFAVGFVGHLSKSAALYNLKNSLHPIALVLECVVTSVYWPLRIFLLHHLVKDPSREMIPLSIDLCLHLVPVVALMVDYIFFMPRWTITPSNAFCACIVLTSLYWFFLKSVIDFENGGEYPYMFLNVETDLVRALIFAAVGLVGFVSFLFFRTVYDVIVHPEIEAVEEAKMKKNL
ncbi:hypothetical protein A9F13_02g03773 [Clavispora lusitaniae]|uniref:Uncharacterized protein n=1 Tax=Clavispora lusitaniae TaxID=36911 RepID=A0AA91T3L5_CLALS|nr:hypothetical protein A9F13_02g03773 [Clavispora lusitaniae]